MSSPSRHASAQWASSGSQSSPSSAWAPAPCGCTLAAPCRWGRRSRCGRSRPRSAPGSPSAWRWCVRGKIGGVAVDTGFRVFFVLLYGGGVSKTMGPRRGGGVLMLQLRQAKQGSKQCRERREKKRNMYWNWLLQKRATLCLWEALIVQKVDELEENCRSLLSSLPNPKTISGGRQGALVSVGLRLQAILHFLML